MYVYMHIHTHIYIYIYIYILELTCAYPCTYSVDLLLSWLGSELIWVWDGPVDLPLSRLGSELAWVQAGLGASWPGSTLA